MTTHSHGNQAIGGTTEDFRTVPRATAKQAKCGHLGLAGHSEANGNMQSSRTKAAAKREGWAGQVHGVQVLAMQGVSTA